MATTQTRLALHHIVLLSTKAKRMQFLLHVVLRALGKTGRAAMTLLYIVYNAVGPVTCQGAFLSWQSSRKHIQRKHTGTLKLHTIASDAVPCLPALTAGARDCCLPLQGLSLMLSAMTGFKAAVLLPDETLGIGWTVQDELKRAKWKSE